MSSDQVVPYVVLAIAAVCVLLILARVGLTIAIWVVNLSQPTRGRRARVLSKRSEVVSRMTGDSGRAIETRYYAAFQMDNGDRWEFEVSGPEYGLLVEGEHGNLRRRGTWFRGFEPDRSPG